MREDKFLRVNYMAKNKLEPNKHLKQLTKEAFAEKEIKKIV